MLFNDNIGKEDTHNEYKVFTLSLLDIEDNEYTCIDDLCVWKYNKVALDTINTYFETYLPKYISSFLNPNSKYKNIKDNKCYLYLGVDDDGSVLGIPYEGELNIEMFNSHINKIFDDLLFYENENDKEDIKNKINIELINLNYDDEDINISECYNIMSDMYDKFNKDTTKLKYENDKITRLKNLWNNELYSVSIKLHHIINDKFMRNLLIDYIKFNNNDNKNNLNIFNNKYSSIDHYCETETYYTFMSKLKSNYKFTQTNNEYIQNNLDNNLEVYTWLTKYKEERVKFLKSIKPNPIRKYTSYDWIKILLSQFNLMIPIWKQKLNKKLNLYVFKITIDVSKRYNIQYNDNNGISTLSYRTFENGIPLSRKFVYYCIE